MLSRRSSRPFLSRALFTLALLSAAALIAVGCGSGDDSGSTGTGGEGKSGVIGGDGPLGWLPPKTWLVSSVDADPKKIDAAVDTLGRLPAWSLAESFLPASDGKGLRLALLKQIAKEAPGKAKISATDLERAFGNRAGFAITSNDYAALKSIDGADTAQSDSLPLALWIEVDDEDLASAIIDDLAKGAATDKTSDGIEYHVNKTDDQDLVWTVRDGLAVITPGESEMKRLINAHEGTSLADDEEAQASVEAAIGDALVGAAVATDPVLDLIPKAAQAEGAIKGKDLDALTELLNTKSVDGLVPDWIGSSLTIDDIGLHTTSTWSNPRDIATPDVGARKLTERMPAGTMTAYGAVADGAELRRVQDAWSEAKDTYDIKLDDLGQDCDPTYTWACTIGIEALKMVLEDNSLASAMEDAGPSATAATQNFDAATLGAAAASAAPGAATQKPIAKAPGKRSFEYTATATAVKYTMPAALQMALTKGGITFTTNADRTKTTIKVAPKSPGGVTLTTALKDPAVNSALGVYAMLGLDPRDLLSPTGVTVNAEKVDDFLVTGFPQNLPSEAVKSLAGDADTLADDDNYQATVKAAKPPQEVGAYGYVNLTAIVDAIFEAAGDSSAQAAQLSSTVRNNLSDIPGIMFWTTRSEVRGEQIGRFEFVIPIEK